MGDNQSQPCDLPVKSNPPGADCDVLVYLTRVLNQRPDRSLLLSDLGALLPEPLRVTIRENGGLRTCVQKYSIFKLSGQPGRERVTLVLGGDQNLLAHDASAALSEPAPEPNTHEFDDEKDHSLVQLRGLPYKATEDDVRQFLGPHFANLKDENGIQLLIGRDGKSSGFARVQFSCPSTARAACQDLHENVMHIDVDDSSGARSSSRLRYVEVFLHSEHPSKGKFKKVSPRCGLQEDNPALEEEVAQISPDDIANEVRQHMVQDGKGELLLSMLGVALSPAARLALRKADNGGVKRLLGQYPNEFRISGEKGRERITYVPSQDYQFTDKVTESNVQLELTAQLDFAVPPSAPPKLLASPNADEGSRVFHKLAMSPSFFQTPSNWGTPDVNQDSRPRMSADIIADIIAEHPDQLMQSMWAPFAFDFNVGPPPDPRNGFNQPPPPDPRKSSDEAPATAPVVFLRGLPYGTTKNEVCGLFSFHNISDRIADESDSIEMLTKNNGKSSGNAIVQLRRAEDVAVVQNVLHMASFGNRYVEVLPHLPASYQAPKRQDSAGQVQLKEVQSAPSQVMFAPTFDACFLNLAVMQFDTTVARCSPEHDFYNAGFNHLRV